RRSASNARFAHRRDARTVSSRKRAALRLRTIRVGREPNGGWRFLPHSLHWQAASPAGRIARHIANGDASLHRSAGQGGGRKARKLCPETMGAQTKRGL